MPVAVRRKYFEKHPDKRGPGDTYLYKGGSSKGALSSARSSRAPAAPPKVAYDRPATPAPGLPGRTTPERPTYPDMPPGKADPDFVDLKRLDAYFALPMEKQADFLLLNPDIAQYLANASSDDQRYRFAVLNGLRAIPKDEPWLRRVYQEKYPDVFDPVKTGEYRQRKTYAKLAEHPELAEDYEKYFNAVYATYAESLKHHGVKPRVELKRQTPKSRRRDDEGRPAVWTSAR